MDRKELSRFFRQVYTMNEQIVVNSERISVKLYNGFHEYSLLPYVNNEVEKLFDLKAEDYDFYLRISYDNNIVPDGYVIEVRSDKMINIKVSNRRAIRFSIEALNKIIKVKNGKSYIPIIKIEDSPSFNVRGIIEGFYGTPWSHNNRLDSLEFLKTHRMNTYMYAPKDDEYHRKRWREFYDSESLNKLLDLKNKCDEYNLDFWYCISPGNDFRYTKQQDFEFLFRKLDQVIGEGVSKFALLLDDIDYKLEGENLKKFYRPGIAHSYICNKVYEYLKANVIDVDYVMCPTEYATNFNTEYIEDVKMHLDSNIKVIWTGYNCIAEVITDNEAKEAKEHFGHEILFWENYPVNDFVPSRLFLGPLVNRGKGICKYGTGMVANPMNQWNLSKIALCTISEYMWNCENYNSEEAFERAIEEVGGKECKEALTLFCNLNRKSVLEYYKFEEVENAIENKDIKSIYEFFKLVEDAIKVLQEQLNKEIYEEMTPWINSFNKQMNLLRAYINGENITLQAEECIKDKFTLGVPHVLNILNSLNCTEYSYEEYKRNNYWEF